MLQTHFAIGGDKIGNLVPQLLYLQNASASLNVHFCHPQPSVRAAEWSPAYYLRSLYDWTWSAPPGGPTYCKRVALASSTKPLWPWSWRCVALGAHGMNNTGHGVSQAYKHSITIYNVSSLLCLSEHRAAPPSSIIFILPGREEISPSACAIWPKRKRPEYMNKRAGVPQADLKLLYYIAPFEISAGGSGRGQELRFFSFFSPAFLPSFICSPVLYETL